MLYEGLVTLAMHVCIDDMICVLQLSGQTSGAPALSLPPTEGSRGETTPSEI